MSSVQLIVIIVLSSVLLGFWMHIFDIHIAIYRPKSPGRTMESQEG